MQTECSPTLFEFEPVERHKVVAGFDGGIITSDAGGLLLGRLDRGLGLIRRMASCFTDRRDPRLLEHTVETLVGQRVFALALGYEDLNDHDELRHDPLFHVLAGKVVGKAEHLPDGANPRFVVTSLGREKIDARGLYEDLYCARGEMENRIKECQLDLFADRTSSATMQANQLRLWFASMAYVLLSELRRIALRHTQFADATCGTIRLKLLKIGALVRRSVRRIKFAMASGFPWQTEFALAYLYLQRAFPR